MKTVPQGPCFSRRLSSRVGTPQGVCVYWRCNGHDDLSRVSDISLRGLFIETSDPRPLGATVKIDFLVQERQIRAGAIWRHVKPGGGLGGQLQRRVEAGAPRAAPRYGEVCA